MLTTCTGCKRKFSFVSVMLEHLKRSCDVTGKGLLCLKNKKINKKLVCKEENCINTNFHNLLEYAKHWDTHTFPGLVSAICEKGIWSPADFALHMSLIHLDKLARKKNQQDNKREVPLWKWEPQATQFSNVPSLNILPFTSFPHRPLVPVSTTPQLCSSIGNQASENTKLMI